jgi:hypothetical protein
MMQALQLLTVVAVGAGLALYGHFKGREERRRERQSTPDPRQQPLFPKPALNQHIELVNR